MDQSSDVGRWPAKARAGSNEALGQALEARRAYLLLVAQEEIDPRVRSARGRAFASLVGHFARCPAGI
jgi:hypothetical protein